MAGKSSDLSYNANSSCRGIIIPKQDKASSKPVGVVVDEDIEDEDSVVQPPAILPQLQSPIFAILQWAAMASRYLCVCT